MTQRMFPPSMTPDIRSYLNDIFVGTRHFEDGNDMVRRTFGIDPEVWNLGMAIREISRATNDIIDRRYQEEARRYWDYENRRSLYRGSLIDWQSIINQAPEEDDGNRMGNQTPNEVPEGYELTGRSMDIDDVLAEIDKALEENEE